MKRVMIILLFLFCLLLLLSACRSDSKWYGEIARVERIFDEYYLMQSLETNVYFLYPRSAFSANKNQCVKRLIEERKILVIMGKVIMWLPQENEIFSVVICPTQ